jgi:hypothetical protein
LVSADLASGLYTPRKGPTMKTKNTKVTGTVVLSCILIFLIGVAYGADVRVVNQASDAFFTKVSKPGNTVTPQRVKKYAKQKFSESLQQIGLDSDVRVTLDFSIGVKGEMLKDPIRDPKGALVKVGGKATLSSPSVKANVRVSEAGKKFFSATYRCGIFVADKDWEGVKSVIDMSVGHMLKEFAKRKRQTTKIVAMLAKEQLIPKEPYVHLVLNFGKVRIHQDGNLWEALGEVGAPAKGVLEQATKNKDPEISDEAKQALKRIKKP